MRLAKLEADDKATFDQKSTMSKQLALKIFDRFGIHGGFLLDLVGRPNYWSAVSQIKSDPDKKDVYGR